MNHSIFSEGEHVKRALRWYSDHRNDGMSTLTLINEASVRFGLSPLEEEWMLRNLLMRPAE